MPSGRRLILAINITEKKGAELFFLEALFWGGGFNSFETLFISAAYTLRDDEIIEV